MNAVTNNPPQPNHSTIRAIGVDLACFVAGLAALPVGYYVAGWFGAAVAAGLAVAVILRGASRLRGPGVGAAFIVVMVALLVIAFGYRIVGWPALVLGSIIAAAGMRSHDGRQPTQADYEAAMEMHNEMTKIDTTSYGSPENPYGAFRSQHD